MRCRECAAEVAVTARVCSGCGAPIVGQPPVVADAVVADTVVAAISSDAAGKAVRAGVAEQALPEPYLPGSGDRVPAELRLVLAGYVSIAGGLFATALACAAAAVLVFFLVLFGDDDVIGSFVIALSVCICGLLPALPALEALKAGNRFSTLLRRPSDPHTATVMASKRGGRTLILDIPWDGTARGYQPLFPEVHLALWMKAGMLVPGERVTVYGGPGGENPLLISSAQRGRAFLGTMKSRSTVQPGPVTPLDEKVSGATLVDWAEWADSTTFSSTGLKSGYDKAEVDVFRSAVRDTFLGVSEPPVKSDDVRGKQFSTRRLREGYDKKQVAAFLDAASLRLAAMESTDRPAGPLVSGALLVAWAEWADSTTFSKPRGGHGYTPIEVDAFREEIRDTFLGAIRSPVRADIVRATQFSSTEDRHDGYDKKQVDAFLDAAGIRLAAMESTDRPAGPLVSGAILAGWAEWADSTRFSIRRLREGYDTAEVDAIRDKFLGVRRPPLTWHAAHGKQFPTHRPGYDVEAVDAFLDKAEPRLAAMRATDKGAAWPVSSRARGLRRRPSGNTHTGKEF
jgi:DivIVA domain-containing protein